MSYGADDVRLLNTSDSLAIAIHRVLDSYGETALSPGFGGGDYSEVRAGGALDMLADLYLGNMDRQDARRVLVDMLEKARDGNL